MPIATSVPPKKPVTNTPCQLRCRRCVPSWTNLVKASSSSSSMGLSALPTRGRLIWLTVASSVLDDMCTPNTRQANGGEAVNPGEHRSHGHSCHWVWEVSLCPAISDNFVPSRQLSRRGEHNVQ